MEDDKTPESIEQEQPSTKNADAIQSNAPDGLVHLTGMYRTWFLDYASYVILERAVPHIEDGLKPVQRRVLYAMHTMPRERMTKVAKIVGATMAYHPHGDASITDALVQIGQKGYLVDMQGNWGNILTGDGAAAGRYIEARLSDLAQEILFDDKITRWKRSYDGSADEPIALPVKFPLLLLQGAEGIAVGLSSKILPHNFNEVIDACCAYLKGEDFELMPDFPTGGLLDATHYNEGRRGGRIKSRANIVKIDNRTLSINELPAGKTTSSLIDSILKANEKGKIKIKRVDDMTAATADIRIHLPSGVSSDKTIDALFALTDCEVSISPNACVIDDDRPLFTSVSDLLRCSADRTRILLRMELERKLSELRELYLSASLERIFIEQRIYKDKDFEEARNEEEALNHIGLRLEPWKPKLIRSVEIADLRKLLEIRMARILRFNIPKHEAAMLQLADDIATTEQNIQGITTYTIKYFQHLQERYGSAFPRRTQLTGFGTIETTKVVELDKKLYINREEGFIGTALKDDEFVCNCSNLDDIIIFFRDGGYYITKVEEKKFIGKREIVNIDRYERNSKRTVYNVIYRDGKKGGSYIKRFNAIGLVRDREYNLTIGTTGSRILYFSANKNAEAETVRIVLKPKTRQRIASYERNFGDILIKSRTARGNIVARYEVLKIMLKERGTSTLGARRVWFDHDVRKLNYDERGELLGNFMPHDKLLVVLNNGDSYTTSFDESNHFEPNLYRVELYNPNKVWTAVYYDQEQGYTYLKRFIIEDSRRESFLAEGTNNRLIALSDTPYPRFAVHFAGKDADRVPMEVEAEDFVGVKGIKAKGKRLSIYNVDSVEELEPTHVPEESDEEQKQEEDGKNIENIPDPDVAIPDEELRDEFRGIQRIQFDDDNEDE